jgi:hypothetical protein
MEILYIVTEEDARTFEKEFDKEEPEKFKKEKE